MKEKEARKMTMELTTNEEKLEITIKCLNKEEFDFILGQLENLD